MKNKRSIIIIAVLLLLAGAGGLFWYTQKQKNWAPPETDSVEVIETDTEDPRFEEYRKIWKENHSINPDYVGEFFIDSGLIRESFVQARSVYREDGTLYRFFTEDGRVVTDPEGYDGNSVYIWTYWKTGEYDYNDHGGSVWMDYRNDLSDQNIIIYGHHFSVWNDETRKKAFTPLEKLMEEENYADNKTATIVLEDEIRHYELVSVYKFDINSENDGERLQFWRNHYNYDDYSGEYDEQYYDNYIKAMKENEYYDTGVKLSTADKTLTLQTCISGHTGEWYEIAVYRLASVENY